MKECAYCGRENADNATHCRECGTDGFKSPEPPPIVEQKHEKPATIASFACIACGGRLRLRLPDTIALFRCPKCKTEYRTQKTGDAKPVFLVVADIKAPRDENSDSRRQTHREVSTRIKAALAVFDLDESATFEQVRLTYRELVKSYHPDRVAGLGAELRHVAEKKTKEINGAYEVLQEFHYAEKQA